MSPCTKDGEAKMTNGTRKKEKHSQKVGESLLKKEKLGLEKS
jgi:hypothetical protein